MAVAEAAEKDLMEEAADYLDEIAARIRQNGMPVQVTTRFGNPPKAIIEFVEQSEIDLLVICTRGQTGPARWLLGNAAFVQQVADKNVELTTEAIRQQSPVLRKMLVKGEIQIAGGMYDIETGAINFS